jgi:hypothetical protein
MRLPPQPIPKGKPLPTWMPESASHSASVAAASRVVAAAPAAGAADRRSYRKLSSRVGRWRTVGIWKRFGLNADAMCKQSNVGLAMWQTEAGGMTTAQKRTPLRRLEGRSMAGIRPETHIQRETYVSIGVCQIAIRTSPPAPRGAPNMTRNTSSAEAVSVALMRRSAVERCVRLAERRLM